MYEREPYTMRPKEPGVLYTDQPLTVWPLTPAMQAVRQQYVETTRDTRSRVYMIDMAKWILLEQEAGRRTAAPRSLPERCGWGDLVGHLRSIGVLRKSDAPGGGWYWILTPCARDWAMWVITNEKKIIDPRWPVADPSADPVAGEHAGGVGGAAEAGPGPQSERCLPPVGERPSREGRSDGGDDPVFPCHHH